MTGVITVVAAIGGNPKFLWYMTRATGIIAIVLLGMVVILGMVTATKAAPKGFAKFLVPDLHRRLSITAAAFLGVHIITALLDSFVHIGLIASIVPFVATYRPVWVGFGAIAFDLLLIVIATSVVRHRFSQGPWKKIHYLSWLVVTFALFHAIGTGSDARVGLVEVVYIVLVAVVALAAIFRTATDAQLRKLAKIGGSAVIVAVPVLALGWSLKGPLRTGWASASSSFSLLPKVTTTTAATSGSSSGGASSNGFVWPVNGGVRGTVSIANGSSGTSTVTLSGTVTGTADVVSVRLVGQVQQGSLVLQGSSVAIGTASAPNTYTGAVAQAGGSTLVLSLHGAQGSVTGALALSINGTTFSGVLQAPAALGSQSASQ
ncbi:MAG: ferric reductase-like transmembrane domain-containing protein [Nitrospiraceae bacterium]|nr:ferric reductase-like transmembrane domain-containing protein [Nitrospiraceae bacterium]